MAPLLLVEICPQTPRTEDEELGTPNLPNGEAGEGQNPSRRGWVTGWG